MATVYRVMKRADHGRPVVGERFGMLGVRVPRDIAPDAEGLVHPGPEGMSVYRSVGDFLAANVPRHLIHLVPGAAGKATDEIWVSGEGEFVDSPFATDLVFRLDLDPERDYHGCITPARVMQVGHFQSALAATRNDWEIVV